MAGKYALLIGNSAFTDSSLARLSAPENDVIALKQVLERPEIAGFKTKLLLNAGMDEARTAVAERPTQLRTCRESGLCRCRKSSGRSRRGTGGIVVQFRHGRCYGGRAIDEAGRSNRGAQDHVLGIA